jgi:aminoglycoside phosphotransferase (APT) family kinase protein
VNEGALPREKVERQVEAFLKTKWGSDLAVRDLQKIFGGASRETYRAKVVRGRDIQGIVVRRDPPSSLIDTERKLEYSAYKAIFPTEIPVPEPLFLEDDPVWLGQPFCVMAEIEGAQSDVGHLSGLQRRVIGEQKWHLLGKLAAMDPVALGFGEFTDIPAQDECAARELDYWADVIRHDEIHPQPVAWAAIRWLKANLPPPAQKLSVVHGDYRSGNFLFTPDEGIKGILDWEMCHVGDPLEDLAWSLDPLWSWGEPQLAGKLLSHGEAIRLWEDTSGLEVDRKVFNWWRVFVAVKAIAIWISSSEDFHNGASKDTILAYAGWIMTDRQNRILLDYLSPSSRNEFGGRLS